MKKFITFLLIGTLAVTGIPLSALAEENEAEVSVEIPSSVSHEGETQETGETEEKTEVTAEDEEIVEKPEAPAEDEEIVEKPDVSTEDEEIVEEPEASVKEVKVLKKPELTYQAHVQNEGWQNWKKETELSGTQGKALRMEALKIRLTGEMAKYYNIYYRTHVQEFGWLGWAKNGEPSGSEGYAYRLEAVQILIKPNILPAPGNTSHAFVKKEKPASRSFSAVLGFDGEKIVRELSAHEKDSYYLGTSYQPLRNPSNLNELMYPKGDRRGDGYSGMNCTGFVAYVVRKCGGNLTPIGQMGLRGGFCNASNWYRYFKTKKVEYYTYSSVSELLKSGKAEKGDIIYCEPKNWNQWGADCHIGFFWGNRSNENKFWHSSTKPGKGNQISAITPVTDPSYICLIKMV